MEACCILPLALWVGVLLGGMLLQACCYVVRVPVPKLQHAASAFALAWLIYLFVQFVNSTSIRVALGSRFWLLAPAPLATIWTLSLLLTLAWSGAVAAFIYRWRLGIPLGRGVWIWAIQAVALFGLYFALAFAIKQAGLDM